MSLTSYSKYKILINPDSSKKQGLRTGDVVRRQYREKEGTVYSLMIVTETGTDEISEKQSPYFICALIEGDEPKTGEILDFVRITNLFDTDRSGALYLTSSDSESPFMDVIDGMAEENSLCFPRMGGGFPDTAHCNRYAAMGGDDVDTHYREREGDHSRIFRITRNANPQKYEKLGFKQTLERKVAHPQRLIVSYKIRGSKQMENVGISFGYTGGEETDASDTITIDEEWKYCLHLVTVDYPEKYSRSFSIDLTAHLKREGDRAEIADLNIVLQSDISGFDKATKTRIGKIKGIVDPIFGLLDGYGAYFQNLYATKNVNIAGTLTAGDENGFSSTFYVGKIHKNVVINSLSPEILDWVTVRTEEKSPVGIGECLKMGYSAKLRIQSASWRQEHKDQKYCFSFWAKTESETSLFIYQDEHFVEAVSLHAFGEWRRYCFSFYILSSDSLNLDIRIDADSAGVLFTAPQLESGTRASQYQPTDSLLSSTEDYGAWFAKGGIGGTIQNPLLKLNPDGSISSRDNSFVINPDGTGHFASGRFKWTKDTIVLQDVTIRWEDFDDETKENFLNKSVSLTGCDVFLYPDELEEVCYPEEIFVYGEEKNFTAEKRKWQYLSIEGAWKNITGENRDFLKILPGSHFWEERKVVSLKYIASEGVRDYEDIFTVRKQYDGRDSYSIYIASEKGTVFKNGVVSTTLSARVMKGGVDVTDKLPENSFLWKRISENPESDALWNSRGITGKTLVITGADVWKKAVFDCEVNVI